MDSTSTQASASTPQDDSLRLKKRKLQDAFHTLDEAVHGPRKAPRETQPPKKKPHLSRSIYSTLSKYGITTTSTTAASTPTLTRSPSAPILSDKTPRLSAILSRVASKAKSAFSFNFTPDSASLLPSAEYRPSSLQSLLSRLETFKLSTYSNKPSSIDAVAASRCGWTNDGKDRLVCGFCNASWVVVGREGMTREAANALVEKQRQGLVENHKNGCPWKTRQCDSSIYCVPLKTPTSMVADVKTNATSLEPLISDVGIRHPLTPTQLSSLKKALFHNNDAQTNIQSNDAMDVDEGAKAELSEASILASIFGWSLVPPASTNDKTIRSASRGPSRSATPSRATAATSISRAGTPKPSTPSQNLAPPSISVSRRSSFSTPGPSTSTSAPARPLFNLSASIFSSKPKPENAMLQCVLCQRRIGLWAFKQTKAEAQPLAEAAAGEDQTSASPVRPKKVLPQRKFDLLTEHRAYCPYVVKSTVVPTISDPNSPTQSTESAPQGAIEGWRAVLAVVLRFKMAERHRVENDVFGNNEDSEVDNVKAMVTGVKVHGGKELLKYVKGLLG